MLCSFACSTKPEGAATSEQRWVHDSVHVVLYLRCLCLFCVMPLVYVQYLQLWRVVQQSMIQDVPVPAFRWNALT
jgi:hypothetical protein